MGNEETFVDIVDKKIKDKKIKNKIDEKPKENIIDKVKKKYNKEVSKGGRIETLDKNVKSGIRKVKEVTKKKLNEVSDMLTKWAVGGALLVGGYMLLKKSGIFSSIFGSNEKATVATEKQHGSTTNNILKIVLGVGAAYTFYSMYKGKFSMSKILKISAITGSVGVAKYLIQTLTNGSTEITKDVKDSIRSLAKSVGVDPKMLGFDEKNILEKSASNEKKEGKSEKPSLYTCPNGIKCVKLKEKMHGFDGMILYIKSWVGKFINDHESEMLLSTIFLPGIVMTSAEKGYKLTTLTATALAQFSKNSIRKGAKHPFVTFFGSMALLKFILTLSDKGPIMVPKEPKDYNNWAKAVSKNEKVKTFLDTHKINFQTISSDLRFLLFTDAEKVKEKGKKLIKEADFVDATVEKITLTDRELILRTQKSGIYALSNPQYLGIKRDSDLGLYIDELYVKVRNGKLMTTTNLKKLKKLAQKNGYDLNLMADTWVFVKYKEDTHVVDSWINLCANPDLNEKDQAIASVSCVANPELTNVTTQPVLADLSNKLSHAYEAAKNNGAMYFVVELGKIYVFDGGKFLMTAPVSLFKLIYERSPDEKFHVEQLLAAYGAGIVPAFVISYGKNFTSIPRISRLLGFQALHDSVTWPVRLVANAWFDIVPAFDVNHRYFVNQSELFKYTRSKNIANMKASLNTARRVSKMLPFNGKNSFLKNYYTRLAAKHRAIFEYRELQRSVTRVRPTARNIIAKRLLKASGLKLNYNSSTGLNGLIAKIEESIEVEKSLFKKFNATNSLGKFKYPYLQNFMDDLVMNYNTTSSLRGLHNLNDNVFEDMNTFLAKSKSTLFDGYVNGSEFKNFIDLTKSEMKADFTVSDKMMVTIKKNTITNKIKIFNNDFRKIKKVIKNLELKKASNVLSAYDEGRLSNLKLVLPKYEKFIDKLKNLSKLPTATITGDKVLEVEKLYANLGGVKKIRAVIKGDSVLSNVVKSSKNAVFGFLDIRNVDPIANARAYARFAKADIVKLEKCISDTKDLKEIIELIAKAERTEDQKELLVTYNKLITESDKSLLKLNTSLFSLDKIIENQKILKKSIKGYNAYNKASMIGNADKMRKYKSAYDKFNKASKTIKGYEATAADITSSLQKVTKLAKLGKVLGALGAGFSVITAGMSFYTAFNTENKDNKMLEYANATVYSGAATLDVLAITSFGANGVFGFAAMAALPYTYMWSSGFDVAKENNATEANWAMEHDSNKLLYEMYTSSYDSLGETYYEFFGGNLDKMEIMKKIFKSLLCFETHGYEMSALMNDYKSLNKLIKNSYTPAHDYFFHTVPIPRDIKSAREYISNAVIFGKMIEERDLLPNQPYLIGVKPNQIDLSDSKYNLPLVSRNGSIMKKTFNPLELVKLYKIGKLAKLEKLSHITVDKLDSLETNYLLRLYGNLKFSTNPKYIMVSDLLGEYLQVKRGILLFSDVRHLPRKNNKLIPFDNLDMHFNAVFGDGDVSIYKKYESVNIKNTKAIMAVYNLAEYFGYIGEATEDDLRNFFSEDKKEYYGIYWDGKSWCVNNNNWLDGEIFSKLNDVSIRKMVEAIRDRGNNVFTHRQDAIFKDAYDFKKITDKMIEILNTGFIKSSDNLYMQSIGLGESYNKEKAKKLKEGMSISEIKKYCKKLKKERWSKLNYEVIDKKTILLSRSDKKLEKNKKSRRYIKREGNSVYGSNWYIYGYNGKTKLNRGFTLHEAIMIGNLMNWMQIHSDVAERDNDGRDPFIVQKGKLKFRTSILNGNIITKASVIKMYEDDGVSMDFLVDILNDGYHKKMF